ncbi:HIT-like protein [Ephemerocybe angulata]|uniref:HIT-like protein n=1 Tax=Ephemerocybe angulata TaxID=980116 RepID=A0A8H6I143_9AGAR|nr:HIT-like protein [Tulosesus angulatus]
MVAFFTSLFSCFRPQEPPGCVFCGIEKLPGKVILYEDDTFVAFEDIRPAAKHHFLVTPKKHVESVRSLKKENVPFLKDMESVGNKLMNKYNIPEDDRRMGFHIPPFNSVNHLHLHVHALPYTSTLKQKKYPIVNGSGLYHKGLVWFVEVGQAIRILESGRSIGIMPC